PGSRLSSRCLRPRPCHTDVQGPDSGRGARWRRPSLVDMDARVARYGRDRAVRHIILEKGVVVARVMTSRFWRAVTLVVLVAAASAECDTNAFAQGQMQPPSRMQATTPSAGAVARTPSFRQPWESEGVPISNNPPCDSDQCRTTQLVGKGLLSPL